MKQLIRFSLLVTCSISAFAQFPLGGKKSEIKAYFAKNVPYASAQVFKVEKGREAICFTKVRVLGDYTFYFDHKGACTEYVVTYDRNELDAVVNRFDNKFCKLKDTKWESEEGIYDVTLIPAKDAENYFSVVYKPLTPITFRENTLASN